MLFLTLKVRIFSVMDSQARIQSWVISKSQSTGIKPNVKWSENLRVMQLFLAHPKRITLNCPGIVRTKGHSSTKKYDVLITCYQF